MPDGLSGRFAPGDPVVEAEAPEILASIASAEVRLAIWRRAADDPIQRLGPWLDAMPPERLPEGHFSAPLAEMPNRLAILCDLVELADCAERAILISDVVNLATRLAALARVDCVERSRIVERRKVPEIETEVASARDAAHDFEVARLRQLIDEGDALGAQRLAHDAVEQGDELRAQLFVFVRTLARHDEQAAAAPALERRGLEAAGRAGVPGRQALAGEPGRLHHQPRTALLVGRAREGDEAEDLPDLRPRERLLSAPLGRIATTDSTPVAPSPPGAQPRFEVARIAPLLAQAVPHLGGAARG